MKIVLIIIIFIAVLGIPLTMMQVQRQQEIRQRASEREPLISLELSPKSKDDIKVGDSIDIDVNLVNNTGKNITALDITINYDQDFLNLATFATSPSKFFPITNDPYIQGSIHYIGINFNPNTNTQFFSGWEPSLTIGTITLRALKEGKANVTFAKEKIKITAIGIESNVFNPNTNSAQAGEYTISSTAIASQLSPTETQPVLTSPTQTPYYTPPYQTPPDLSCPDPSTLKALTQLVNSCFGKSEDDKQWTDCQQVDKFPDGVIDGSDYNQILRLQIQCQEVPSPTPLPQIPSPTPAIAVKYVPTFKGGLIE